MLEHWRNEEILEETRVEPIVLVMRRLEWFGHVKRTDETENIRAVVRNEDGGDALQRKTQVEMGGYCQKRYETVEDQGGMGH